MIALCVFSCTLVASMTAGVMHLTILRLDLYCLESYAAPFCPSSRRDDHRSISQQSRHYGIRHGRASASKLSILTPILFRLPLSLTNRYLLRYFHSRRPPCASSAFFICARYNLDGVIATQLRDADSYWVSICIVAMFTSHLDALILADTIRMAFPIPHVSILDSIVNEHRQA